MCIAHRRRISEFTQASFRFNLFEVQVCHLLTAPPDYYHRKIVINVASNMLVAGAVLVPMLSGLVLCY